MNIKGALHNNMKDKWVNDAKEQPYLMPGTSEYKERQEDLQMHDPFRPDDAWHDKLEESNEDLQEALMLKADRHKEQSTQKIKTRRQAIKASEFEAVKHAAIAEAAKTDTKEDDKRAAGMRQHDLDSLVYDNGVTEEEYLPKALSKYMD